MGDLLLSVNITKFNFNYIDFVIRKMSPAKKVRSQTQNIINPV